MFDKKIKKFGLFFIIISLIQLFYIFHFRSGFILDVIKNPFKSDSGHEYAVSPEIIEMKDILLKLEIKDFNLSKTIAKDTYLFQRSIEFNYPIRLKKESKNIFFLKNESIPNACGVIKTGSYLILARC